MLIIDWYNTIIKEVSAISELLNQQLSDEPEELIQDLVKIEACYARTGSFLATANSYLDREKFTAMPSKENKMTEMERKVTLDNEIAGTRRIRDHLEALHDAIKVRINLGQSLLAYKRQSLENMKVVKTSSTY